MIGPDEGDQTGADRSFCATQKYEPSRAGKKLLTDAESKSEGDEGYKKYAVFLAGKAC